jgi:peroxiredoxin
LALAFGPIPGTFAQAPESSKARFDAIVRAQAGASERYHDGLSAAKTPETQKAAVDRYLEDVRRNTRAGLDLVSASPNDPVVVDTLKFVIRTARAGPGDESYRAMEILAREHVRDPGMGDVCWQVFYFVHTPIAERLIRTVHEQNSSRTDRGLACHVLATYLRSQARMIRRVREKPPDIDRYTHEFNKAECARIVKEKDPEAVEKEAEALLERIVAEFGDVKQPLATRTIGEIAAGELFAMRNLAVGKVALEVEGKDEEGQSFKLSDYRGKVVVLTFSGNWCGPCVGMYPQERALVAKLKAKPFAMVSVSTDQAVETLKKAIDEGDITWRCWWDGGTDGPITTRWGVASFPSIFVLDTKGVIRFKDVRGDDLDRAVTSLLENAVGATR